MTLKTDRKIALDTGAIAEQLAPLLAKMKPTPSVESISRFINFAFFASLEQEEGRRVTFALAFVDAPMLSNDGGNPQYWRPVLFREPRLASLHALAKLAPAVDYRQTFVAIIEKDEELHIAGLIRTNTEHYRISRGEADSAGHVGYDPLIARASDTGIITLDIGYSRAFTIARGVLLPEGINVFNGGFIFALIYRYAQAARLDGDCYNHLLRGTIQRLASRGHGGTLVLLPTGDTTSIDFRFDMMLPSAALQDVIHFAGGKNLGFTAETDTGSESPEEIVKRRARKRAIQEHEFMRDGCEFAADLASVDGALVLNADMSIAGFGGHLLYSEPAIVLVERALDLEGSKTEPASLRTYGTRHNSAARFCWHRPGATAFVVSQDGAVSCFHRKTADSPLLMWRPVALETHWRAQTANRG